MLKALEKLDEMNKAATVQQKFDENHLLLVALSTTVMVTKNKQLPKEYYQWTRSYFQHVRHVSGRQLPNIKKLMEKLDSFETENKIEDELRYEDLVKGDVVPPYESSSDDDEESDDGFSKFIGNQLNPLPTSTPRAIANHENNQILSSTTGAQGIQAFMPAPSNQSLVP